MNFVCTPEDAKRTKHRTTPVARNKNLSKTKMHVARRKEQPTFTANLGKFNMPSLERTRKQESQFEEEESKTYKTN